MLPAHGRLKSALFAQMQALRAHDVAWPRNRAFRYGVRRVR